MAGVISLSGYSLLAAMLILTVMIAPIMISIFSDGLRAVRPGWIEGSLASGVNRWRTFWKIGVRTARPAIVAGTVLAVARALGEAVMLAMVSGSVGFAPNPADGLIFLYEPSRPLAPTIIKSIDSLGSKPAERDPLRDRRPAPVLGGDVLWPGAWRSMVTRCGGGRAPADGSHGPKAAHIARSVEPRRPARPGCVLGARDPVLRDRRRDRRLLPGSGAALREPRPAHDRAQGRLQPGDHRRHPRPADRDPVRRRDGDGDRAPGGGGRSPSGSANTARPPALARVAESTIEAIAGIPSIVLALFGTSSSRARRSAS